MSGYRVISSDNHVFEPGDLWTSRAESKFKDRMPHVERLEDGDWWIYDGQKHNPISSGTQAGLRFEEPEKLSFEAQVEELRPGGYIPEEHVKDMDIDGIDVSIVYPTIGLGLYRVVQDSELLSSIFRTYNDWVGEFCSAVPKRLKGIAMLNLDDVHEGVKELERCAKMGFVGAMISVYPPEEHSYDEPEYESLWATAQDLGIPLSLHITTNRPAPGQEFQGLDTLSATAASATAAVMSNREHWVRMSLANIIFGGAFERYPKLQVGSVEHDLSWVPHFLDRIDYTYTQTAEETRGDHRFKGDALPSDFFHNNVFLGFQEDALGIRLRDIIGVDNLQWGADYPHPESTFPRSRQILEEILVDCTEEEKAKIAGGNAARVYRLQ